MGAADQGLQPDTARATAPAHHGESLHSAVAEVGPTPFDAELTEAVRRARQHSIGDVLRRTSRRTPGRLAIVSGARRLTYQDFNSIVNRVANSLAVRDLTKGDRLALLSRNSWQSAVLTFATAKIGVVLVPINFMLGSSEIAYILSHCGASGLVVEDALGDTGTAALAEAGIARGLRGWIALSGAAPAAGFEDFGNWAEHSDDGEPAVSINDDDPLRLMYTSGTESRPKGVLLGSRSLISQYVSCIVDGGMTADDIEVHALPMYHCAQLDCFFGPDVYLGATSVILPDPQPERLLHALESEHATKLFAPPTVWISLLRSPAFDSADLSSLRKGYYGAAAMPVEVLHEIRRRIPQIRLWNFYGQTEMAPVATILPPEEQVAHAGSAGRPVLNVETAVVDEFDRPVETGEVGEIVHRSPHAALGYYLDPEKTARAFRDGWFHSGDLGVFDEQGRLRIVDRKKDMIKTGGENVASREVEEIIYRMGTVAEVAVFGIAHPRWIEAVVAVVVPRLGATIDAEDVLTHCRSAMAGYKTPKYVVIADGLPKNPSGKILKRTLRHEHAGLAPGGDP